MDGVNPRVDGAAEGDRQRRAPALTRDPSFRQLVIDMAQEGIAVVDPRGEVALYNASMERITGYAQSEARAGFPGALIRDPDSRREALAQIERAFHGRPIDRHEWEITRKDGATRIVLASARGFSYQRRRLAIILVLDVTGQRRDQRRANAYLARLRRLSSEMVLAEERERRRIASDIHDGLGDELSLARIKAAELTSAYSGGSGAWRSWRGSWSAAPATRARSRSRWHRPCCTSSACMPPWSGWSNAATCVRGCR